jgi:hypothetical protein
LLGTANARAQVSATSAVYVRSDTDHTTVIAPRVSLSAPVASAARLDLVYTADVWTSASVDIRSSASKAVTEQRDEINAALSHELGDVRLAGSYRYSHEPDYESHGASRRKAPAWTCAWPRHAIKSVAREIPASSALRAT